MFRKTFFYDRFNQIKFEGFYKFVNQNLIKEFYKLQKIEDTNHEIKILIIYSKISVGGNH